MKSRCSGEPEKLKWTRLKLELNLSYLSLERKKLDKYMPQHFLTLFLECEPRKLKQIGLHRAISLLLLSSRLKPPNPSSDIRPNSRPSIVGIIKRNCNDSRVICIISLSMIHCWLHKCTCSLQYAGDMYKLLFCLFKSGEQNRFFWDDVCKFANINEIKLTFISY